MSISRRMFKRILRKHILDGVSGHSNTCEPFKLYPIGQNKLKVDWTRAPSRTEVVEIDKFYDDHMTGYVPMLEMGFCDTMLNLFGII